MGRSVIGCSSKTLLRSVSRRGKSLLEGIFLTPTTEIIPGTGREGVSQFRSVMVLLTMLVEMATGLVMPARAKVYGLVSFLDDVLVFRGCFGRFFWVSLGWQAGFFFEVATDDVQSLNSVSQIML